MEDRQRLLSILHDANEDVDFENEAALVENGFIDSLDITVIIAAIDESFHIHIKAVDIVPENFNSVEAMLLLIVRYRAGL